MESVCSTLTPIITLDLAYFDFPLDMTGPQTPGRLLLRCKWK